MEPLNLKDVDRKVETRCVVCGAPLDAGTVCEICRGQRMTLQRYAELFWEEA